MKVIVIGLLSVSITLYARNPNRMMMLFVMRTFGVFIEPANRKFGCMKRALGVIIRW